MSARAASTRDRMVDSAARLLTERGIGAVTVDGVLADSGAPRGSVYHHFPGGRDELALAGARRAVGYIDAVVDSTTDASQLVQALVRLYEGQLRRTDYRAGCPVMALVTDAHTAAPPARELAESAIGRWRDRLADYLATASAADPVRLATFVLSALEGAVGMCRIERSLTPLGDVQRLCLDLLDTTITKPDSPTDQETT